MKYVVYAAMVLVTLGFGAAGTAKLMGVPMMHQSFANLGLPGWFGYFIGACEVAGAIGIWLRPTSRLAACGLAAVLLGALYYHLNFPPVSAGVPALVLLVLCGFLISRKGTGVIG
ncbi:MAG: DoxX family protein [Cypionkella sp.]|jgi:putative oxidoreductase